MKIFYIDYLINALQHPTPIRFICQQRHLSPLIMSVVGHLSSVCDIVT